MKVIFFKCNDFLDVINFFKILILIFIYFKILNFFYVFDNFIYKNWYYLLHYLQEKSMKFLFNLTSWGYHDRYGWCYFYKYYSMSSFNDIYSSYTIHRVSTLNFKSTLRILETKFHTWNISHNWYLVKIEKLRHMMASHWIFAKDIWTSNSSNYLLGN